jgi:hypothetical protein
LARDAPGVPWNHPGRGNGSDGRTPSQKIAASLNARDWRVPDKLLRFFEVLKEMRARVPHMHIRISIPCLPIVPYRLQSWPSIQDRLYRQYWGSFPSYLVCGPFSLPSLSKSARMIPSSACMNPVTLAKHAPSHLAAMISQIPHHKAERCTIHATPKAKINAIPIKAKALNNK